MSSMTFTQLLGATAVLAGGAVGCADILGIPDEFPSCDDYTAEEFAEYENAFEGCSSAYTDDCNQYAQLLAGQGCVVGTQSGNADPGTQATVVSPTGPADLVKLLKDNRCILECDFSVGDADCSVMVGASYTYLEIEPPVSLIGGIKNATLIPPSGDYPECSLQDQYAGQ